MDWSTVDWKAFIVILQPLIMWGLNWVQDHSGEWKLPFFVKAGLGLFIGWALGYYGGAGGDTGLVVGTASILSYKDGRRKPV